jgi:hypothetical protein
MTDPSQAPSTIRFRARHTDFHGEFEPLDEEKCDALQGIIQQSVNQRLTEVRQLVPRLGTDTAVLEWDVGADSDIHAVCEWCTRGTTVLSYQPNPIVWRTPNRGLQVDYVEDHQNWVTAAEGAHLYLSLPTACPPCLEYARHLLQRDTTPADCA